MAEQEVSVLRLEAEGDSSNAQSAIDELVSSLHKLDSSMSSLSDMMTEFSSKFSEHTERLNEHTAASERTISTINGFGSALTKVTIATAGTAGELGNLSSEARNVGSEFLHAAVAARDGLGEAFVVLGGAIAGAIAAFAGLGAEADHWANEQMKLGAITGMTQEETEKWASVMAVAGGNINSLERASFMLTRQMGVVHEQIAAGAPITSRAGKALYELGISVNDDTGKMKQFSEIFPQIMDRLGSMADKTERNTKVSELFGGRMGMNLIPVLDHYSESMRFANEMNDRFHMGIENASEFAVQMNEKMRMLTLSFEVLATRVGPPFLDFMTHVADAAGNLANGVLGIINSNGFQELARLFKDELGIWLPKIESAFKGFMDAIGSGIKFVREHAEAQRLLALALAAVVAELIAKDLAGAFASLTRVIGVATVAVQGLTTAFGAGGLLGVLRLLPVALAGLLSPIAVASAAFVAVGVLITGILTNWMGMGDAFKRLVALYFIEGMQLFSEAAHFIGDLVSMALQHLASLSTAMARFASSLGPFGAGLRSWLDTQAHKFLDMAADVDSALDTMDAALKRNAQSWIDWGNSVRRGVNPSENPEDIGVGIPGAVGFPAPEAPFVPGPPTPGTGQAAGAVANEIATATNALAGAQQAAKSAAEAYRDTLLRLADTAEKAVKPAFQSMFDLMSTGANLTGVVAAIGALTDAAVNLGQQAEAISIPAITAETEAIMTVGKAHNAEVDAIRQEVTAQKDLARSFKDATDALKQQEIALNGNAAGWAMVGEIMKRTAQELAAIDTHYAATTFSLTEQSKAVPALIANIVALQAANADTSGAVDALNGVLDNLQVRFSDLTGKNKELADTYMNSARGLIVALASGAITAKQFQEALSALLPLMNQLTAAADAAGNALLANLNKELAKGIRIDDAMAKAIDDLGKQEWDKALEEQIKLKMAHIRAVMGTASPEDLARENEGLAQLTRAHMSAADIIEARWRKFSDDFWKDWNRSIRESMLEGITIWQDQLRNETAKSLFDWQRAQKALESPSFRALENVAGLASGTIKSAEAANQLADAMNRVAESAARAREQFYTDRGTSSIQSALQIQRQSLIALAGGNVEEFYRLRNTASNMMETAQHYLGTTGMVNVATNILQQNQRQAPTDNLLSQILQVLAGGHSHPIIMDGQLVAQGVSANVANTASLLDAMGGGFGP